MSSKRHDTPQEVHTQVTIGSILLVAVRSQLNECGIRVQGAASAWQEAQHVHRCFRYKIFFLMYVPPPDLSLCLATSSFPISSLTGN